MDMHILAGKLQCKMSRSSGEASFAGAEW